MARRIMFLIIGIAVMGLCVGFETFVGCTVATMLFKIELPILSVFIVNCCGAVGIAILSFVFKLLCEKE